MTQEEHEAIWQDIGRPRESDEWCPVGTFGGISYVMNVTAFERFAQAHDDEHDLIRLGSDFQ